MSETEIMREVKSIVRALSKYPQSEWNERFIKALKRLEEK